MCLFAADGFHPPFALTRRQSARAARATPLPDTRTLRYEAQAIVTEQSGGWPEDGPAAAGFTLRVEESGVDTGSCHDTLSVLW